MAIKIEHGGQAGPAAGQVIGQGLQNQANIQQRDRQLLAKVLSDITGRKDARTVGGGGSRGGGGSSSARANDANKRLALKAEADKQAKEQGFSRDMALKQEAARLDSAQWEYEYTTKQKQEMAQLERGDQLVEQSDDFSPEEKAAYRQMSVQRKAGFNPTLKPIDPSEIQYEEGKGPQNTWINPETGATEALDRSNNVRVVTQYKETKGYLERQIERDTQADIEKAIVERTQKLEDNKIKIDFEREQSIRKYIQEQEVEFQDPKEPLDKEGKMNMLTRLKRPAEVEAEMRALGYGAPSAGLQPDQQQIPVIETREQRDLLPPNTEYIGPDGIKRRTGGLLPQQPIPLGRR